MMPRSLWCTMPVALLLLAACRSSGPEGEQAVELARVGDRVISAAEFEAEMAERSRGRHRYFERVENRRALLDELIRHHLLVQEALAEGIADEPEFRAMVDRMLIQRLRDKRMAERLESLRPDDAAVAEYYEQNRAAFTRPARRQVAMIRVDVPASANEAQRQEQRERAEAARAAALALPDSVMHFDSLAIDYSDDRSSRYRGGVVGWLVDHPERRYQWPDVVLDAAFALDEPGRITPVIETDGAFYLVRLVAFEPGRIQPLEQVADGIRHRLMREQGRELESELFADIERRHEIRVDEAALEAVQPPESPQEAAPRPDGPPAMPNDPAR